MGGPFGIGQAMNSHAIPMNATADASAAQAIRSELDRRIRRGRLLYKLLLLFVALAVLPLLLTGWRVIHEGERAIQEQIVGAKTKIAQKVATNVTGYLEDKRNTLQVMHKSGEFLAMRPARQREILSSVMNAYPMFMRMQVVDLKGREVATVDRMGGPSRTDRRIQGEALRAIRGLGDYRGSVSRSPEGYPQIVMGVPIEKIPGRPVGMLLAVVNLIDLSSLVKDVVIDKMGYVYIVDPARRQLVAHPAIEALLSAEPPPEVRAAALAPEGGAEGAIEFKDQLGRRFLATYADVPGLGWRVFVQQPLEEAYSASRRMRAQVLKVLLGVLLGTIFLGTLVSQLIVRRVRRLEGAMQQVAEGNFDVSEVPVSNDEFGSLTERFLGMAAALKDKTARLLTAQRELQMWNTELETRVQERTRDLRAAQDQLIAQEKLAALGQMASVVGHELRNPLAVMNNSIYFLKTKLGKHGGESEGAADPAQARIEKHLNVIESEIAKSNTIIRDILDFARNRALNAAPRKLDALVEQSIERIARPANVRLETALGLGDLEVELDEDEIRQVLVNLMENACQAMPSGGTLFVGTKAHETLPGTGTGRSHGPAETLPGTGTGPSHVEICIRDTGSGIPPEHLGKIFAPFFTTKSRGTGLGLAVVKKIIDRHQGTLEVRSQVGEGTAFVIRLPRRRGRGPSHG